MRLPAPLVQPISSTMPRWSIRLRRLWRAAVWCSAPARATGVFPGRCSIRASALRSVWSRRGRGEVALVFGREYAGLTNEELQRCQYHVHIPSDPEFGSLNLAAAVQVLTYEVRMTWLAAQGRPTKSEKLETTAMLDTQPVTVDELEHYFGHLEQTLIEIGFLDPQKPRHLMPRLRRLYGRSGITKLEMNILRGILTETQKAARGEPHKRRKE